MFVQRETGDGTACFWVHQGEEKKVERGKANQDPRVPKPTWECHESYREPNMGPEGAEGGAKTRTLAVDRHLMRGRGRGIEKSEHGSKKHSRVPEKSERRTRTKGTLSGPGGIGLNHCKKFKKQKRGRFLDGEEGSPLGNKTSTPERALHPLESRGLLDGTCGGDSTRIVRIDLKKRKEQPVHPVRKAAEMEFSKILHTQKQQSTKKNTWALKGEGRTSAPPHNPKEKKGR